MLGTGNWVEAKKKAPRKTTAKKKIVKKTAKKIQKKAVVKLQIYKPKPVIIKKTTLITAEAQRKEDVPALTSRMALSPKIGIGTGGLSSFGVGCEFAMPIMPSVDLMLELGYWPVSGAPIMMIGGNGIYKFAPVEGMPVNFYSGGGLFYQMINVTGSTGNINAFGFQVLGGADIPIPGAGNAFAQMKYGIANYTYTIGAFSFSASSGGFVLEGGYRFVL